jgi:multiple sugar transport system permease protein
VLVELADQQQRGVPLLVGRDRPKRVRRVLSVAEPYLYLLPALVGVGIWTYRPLVQTFQYSFYSWDLLPTAPKLGVGWSNYRQLVHLPALWQAVATSGVFLVGLLLFGLALPVAIGAFAQHVSPRSQTTYRALIFLPVLVSPVVTATIWQFLLSPLGGVVDTVLKWFGLAQTNWLQQPNTARYAIATISGWKVLGISLLIVTAGLAAISSEYYEAAAIDGASRLQIFRRITLPLLSPTLLFMFITVVLLSSQLVFPLVNALTMGGPGNSTTDVYYFLYKYGFQSFDVGLASAAAVCFFLAFGVVALICVRLLERFSFFDN